MPNPDRFGSAGALLLVAAALALGLLGWFLLNRGSADATSDSAERSVETPNAGAHSDGGLAEIDPQAPRAVSQVEIRNAGEYAQLERTYDGTGIVRGEVRVVEGVPYPETWTLHLDASTFSVGRKHAVPRKFVAEPGMRTFEEFDVPLGGYSVYVTAPGLASRKQELPLYKFADMPESPGVSEVHISLELRPIAYVRGQVRRADGTVANDLAMTLAQKRLAGDQGDVVRFDVTTDAIGSFRFDDVEPGPWMLHVGGLEGAFMPPMPVTMSVEPIELDAIELPELATLDLLVLDIYGRGFPDVDVKGYLRGSGRGSFTAKSDSFGRIAIPYLTPGPWRIEGEYPAEEATGRIDVPIDTKPSNDPIRLIVR